MALPTRHLWHRVFSKEFHSVRRGNFLVQLIVTTNATPVVWPKCVQDTFLWSKIKIYQHRNYLHHLRYLYFLYFPARRIRCWMKTLLLACGFDPPLSSSLGQRRHLDVIYKTRETKFQHVSKHWEDLLMAEFTLEPDHSMLNLFQATSYPSETIYSSETDKRSTPWRDCLNNNSLFLLL